MFREGRAEKSKPIVTGRVEAERPGRPATVEALARHPPHRPDARPHARCPTAGGSHGDVSLWHYCQIDQGIDVSVWHVARVVAPPAAAAAAAAAAVGVRLCLLALQKCRARHRLLAA